MTGSGQKTFLNRLVYHTQASNIRGYVINLDPAVLKLPFGANIDIRDKVNYKEVMKEFNLGPSGGILTPLNMFATKFDEGEEGSFKCMMVGASNIRDLLMEFSSSLDFFAISSGDGRIKGNEKVDNAKSMENLILKLGETRASTSNHKKKADVIFFVEMTGSGKTTFLGRNGGILTSSNLFATKFDEVIAVIEESAAELDYVMVDICGQCKLEPIAGNLFGNFWTSTKGISTMFVSLVFALLFGSVDADTGSGYTHKLKTHFRKASHIDKRLALGLGVGLSVLFVAIVIILYFYYRNQNVPAVPNPAAVPDVHEQELIQLTLERRAFIDNIHLRDFSPSEEGPDHIGDLCPICLVEFEPASNIRSLPWCQHVYHIACLDQDWAVGRLLRSAMCRLRYHTWQPGAAPPPPEV